MVTQKNDIYILRQFNPEKSQLYSETVFADKKLKMKHGAYREFDYNGEGYLVGQYSNDLKTGIWNGYYAPGVLRSKSIYINGKQEGENRVWYDNGQIKDITRFSADKKNGKREEYYKSGKLWIEENYVDDKLDGDYFEYDSLGGVLNQWGYRMGEVIDYVIGKEWDEQQPLPLFSGCGSPINTKEYQECQRSNMYRHINDNIVYPKIDQAFSVSGMVYVKFVVEKNGKILHTEILKGLTESLNNESIRIIKSMPPWTPGYQNGEPVRVWFTMPIAYKLE